MQKQLDAYVFCPTCKNALVIREIDGDPVKECTQCGFIFWNKSKPVTSVILHNERTVLLMQRLSEPFKDFWVLPGGFLKSSETAEKAVRREVREEIGADAEIERVLGTYLIDEDPRGVHLDIIFVGQIIGDITVSDEIKHWRYFPADALPVKIAYKHREAIQDWIRKI